MRRKSISLPYGPTGADRFTGFRPGQGHKTDLHLKPNRQVIQPKGNDLSVGGLTSPLESALVKQTKLR